MRQPGKAIDARWSRQRSVLGMGVAGGSASVWSRGFSVAARVITSFGIAGIGLLMAGSPSLGVERSATPSHPVVQAIPEAPFAPIWQTAWTSPMDFYGGDAVNATARDVAAVAISGTSIELRLSNQWSSTATTFGAVTVAVEQTGPAVIAGSTVPVTFNGGSLVVTVAPGQDVTSDPVDFTVHAGESLAVSMWVEGSATVSIHYCCAGHIDSYATPNGAGNQTQDEAGNSFTFSTSHNRWLSAIVVTGTPAQGTLVALGDSITDGFNDAGYNWTIPLQQRIALLPSNQQLAVVNEGISGNTLTVFPSPSMTYALTSGGLPGVTRLSRDVLSLPGTRDVVLFLGTNDIWFGGRLAPGSPEGSAASIIAAMQSVITQVHAAGMKIFGVTLLPRTSSPPPDGEIWTAADQSNLEQVNAWMRNPTSGFDGVIDFAAVVADVYNGQCDANALFGPYNSGDNLHPSDAGELAMANAIPTTLFGLPEAPHISQQVVAIPTAGCPGAALATQALALAQPPATPPTTSTTTSLPPLHRAVRHTKPGSGVLEPTLIAGGALVVVASLAGILLRRRSLRRRRVRQRILGRPPPSSPPARLQPPARR